MRIFSILTIFLIAIACFGQKNSLTINDPHNLTSFSTYKGDIDTAYMSIRPHGPFIECNYYITFSQGEHPANSSEQLEIEYRFELPEQAIVTSAWLWVGNNIINAEIIHTQQAQAIYDTIVNAKKDPLLFVKKTSTEYQMNVFPLMPGSTRKVRVSFLLPCVWQNDNITGQIPITFFESSFTPLKQLDLILYDEAGLDSIVINNDTALKVTAHYNPVLGNYYKSTIPQNKLNNQLSISYSGEVTENGVYFRALFNKKRNGKYILGIVPDKIISSLTTRKICFIIDYHKDNQISKDSLINELSYALKASLKETDKFTVLFYDNSIKSVFSNWQNASDSIIDSAIALLKQASINSSQTSELLIEANKFINNKNAKQAESILISNASIFSSEKSTLDEIVRLQQNFESIIPKIHILNYNLDLSPVFFVSNKPYIGGSYFFNYLSLVYNGELINHTEAKNNSLRESIMETINITGPSFSKLELNADPISPINAAGFFEYEPEINIYNKNNQAVYHVGLFNGDTAKFKVKAIYSNDTTIIETFVVFDSLAKLRPDTMIDKLWHGYEIAEKEKTFPSTQDQKSIIRNLSTTHSILSLYTAFLAVEDSNTTYCRDCIDEPILTAFDLEPDNLVISAFPNPFEDQLNIGFSNLDFKTIVIYDFVGRIVFEKVIKANSINISTSTYAPGIYTIQIQSANVIERIKVLKK